MTETGTSTELTITRVLAALRALVWRAWTDEVELARWLHLRGVSAELRDAGVQAGWDEALVNLATAVEGRV